MASQHNNAKYLGMEHRVAHGAEILPQCDEQLEPLPAKQPLSHDLPPMHFIAPTTPSNTGVSHLAVP